MRVNILAAVALIGMCSNGLQAQEHRAVSVAKIGNVLHCLRSKLADMENYEPPQIGSSTYRVRYVYGSYSPDDENNELQLVVYSPKEKSAIYYTVYLEEEKRHHVIDIGQMGTLIQENGKLVLDENPGGNATYFHIQKLVDFLERKPVITIPAQYVRLGSTTCIFQR